MVRNPPAVQENGIQSLGWEDPLEEGMATHSSIPAWRIPHGQRSLATVYGVSKSWTWLSNFPGSVCLTVLRSFSFIDGLI